MELENTKKYKRNFEDLLQLLTSVASTIVELLLFIVGAYMAIKGVITAGVVVAFIQLLNYVIEPISALGPLVANYKAAEALIIKHDNLVQNKKHSRTGTKVFDFKDSISFENVSFSYENEKNILENLSFSFKKGKSYAIVGASGSGKSTILSLLLAYHNSYKGNINIDGNELKNVDSESIYDLVSLIQQDVFIFDNTIEENITLFNVYDQDEISEVVSQSGLCEIIKEKGENYICGENGKYLSGGEKQRLSIARSLLRKTPILLMDEGTSALDYETAKSIEDTILKLPQITKIIVTHRLHKDSLHNFDNILVMKNGTVIESGTFDDLLNLKGYFYSLFNVYSD